MHRSWQAFELRSLKRSWRCAHAMISGQSPLTGYELRTPMSALSLQISAIERMAANDGPKGIEAEL